MITNISIFMTRFFFELYAFIILPSTLVLGINYFVIITRPLHPIPVRKIIDGEIKTSFKPTDEMWADGLSKPLQGNKFVLFRNQVLNANIVN